MDEIAKTKREQNIAKWQSPFGSETLEQFTDYNGTLNNLQPLRRSVNISNFIIQTNYFHFFLFDKINQFIVHDHPVYEVSLTINGEIVYEIDKYTIPTKPGDLVIFPPQKKHSWHLKSENCMTASLMSFMHYDSHAFAYSNKGLIKAIVDRRYKISNFCTYAVNIEKIAHLLQEKSAFFEDEILLLVNMNYLNLFKIIFPDWQRQIIPDISDHFNCPHEKLVELTKLYIYDNLTRQIKLSELEKYLSISKDHLNKIFKSKEGMSIGQYILKERLRNTARKLLILNDGIEGIALRNGFNSFSYFIKAFKKQYGVTPGEYRSHNKI